jgi:glycosyltransferase involved in cell wall biosynthesis
MNVTVGLEHRFLRTPDGRIWTDTIFPRPFWSRYLGVFDGVTILARAYDVPKRLDSWQRADGDGVSLVPLPPWVGPLAFVRNLAGVFQAIRGPAIHDSAVILRVPGTIGTVVSWCLKRGQPYAIEVVQDPYAWFSKRSVPHPLRLFFRWWFTESLKSQCRKAACSLYLTERTLQDLYPPASSSQFLVSASESDLPDEAFVSSTIESTHPNSAENIDESKAARGRPFRLIFVGTLERLYKAQDVLVTAFAQTVAAGLDAELQLIGNGRERPGLERLAQSLGVGDRVKFPGQLLGGEPIRRQLDASDLFVLASWAEGMPKAMLEAMARGLPCIGSTVGGIPEILPEIALVQPGNAAELAAKILQFARNHELRRDMGRRNLETARRFHENLLQPKRIAFYKRLRQVTEEWQLRSRRRSYRAGVAPP